MWLLVISILVTGVNGVNSECDGFVYNEFCITDESYVDTISILLSLYSSLVWSTPKYIVDNITNIGYTDYDYMFDENVKAKSISGGFYNGRFETMYGYYKPVSEIENKINNFKIEKLTTSKEINTKMGKGEGSEMKWRSEARSGEVRVVDVVVKLEFDHRTITQIAKYKFIQDGDNTRIFIIEFSNYDLDDLIEKIKSVIEIGL